MGSTPKRKYTLDERLAMIQQSVPQIVEKIGTRFNIEDADLIEMSRPRKMSEQYPIIVDVSDEVAEVIQAHFGVTDAKDAKPVIATSSLFTCIGLLGYDREHNLGFLMHIQPSNDVRRGLERLYQELARTHPGFEREFDTHIVASTFHDFQNYRDLKETLRGNPSGLGTRLKYGDPIEFVPDMKREGKPGEGVALDTRNGTISAYLRDTLSEGPCEFRYNKLIPEKSFKRLTLEAPSTK